MPLFGKHKEDKQEQQISGSIKSVPRYDEAIKFLADCTESEYEIVTTLLLAEIYGSSVVEVAWDKARISMLLPSSINVNANFQNLMSLPLNSLDVGVTPDRTTVVGLRKTFINRKFIDGFVNCMIDIYGISWKNMQALIHKTQTFPNLLIADQLTFCVAPVTFPMGALGELGKYNPESKISVQKISADAERIKRHLEFLKEEKAKKEKDLRSTAGRGVWAGLDSIFGSGDITSSHLAAQRIEDLKAEIRKITFEIEELEAELKKKEVSNACPSCGKNISWLPADATNCPYCGVQLLK